MASWFTSQTSFSYPICTLAKAAIQNCSFSIEKFLILTRDYGQESGSELLKMSNWEDVRKELIKIDFGQVYQAGPRRTKQLNNSSLRTKSVAVLSPGYSSETKLIKSNYETIHKQIFRSRLLLYNNTPIL